MGLGVTCFLPSTRSRSSPGTRFTMTWAEARHMARGRVRGRVRVGVRVSMTGDEG